MNLTTIATILSALIGGGAVAALVNAFTGRGKRKVDVAAGLTDSTLEWARELKADAAETRLAATEARREAAEARREAAEARREARAAGRQVAVLAQAIQALRDAILDPDATLDRLRKTAMGVEPLPADADDRTEGP
jgi:uncharacterized membrane protein YqiK